MPGTANARPKQIQRQAPQTRARSRLRESAVFTCSPLITHFGTLGDTVLLTTLLHRLHLRYGYPCRLLGSGKWLEPLLGGHPDVQAIFRIANPGRPYWLDSTQRNLVRQLRMEMQGVVYVCDAGRADRTRALLRRAGVLVDQCRFVDHDCPRREGEHPTERWQRFAAMTPPAFASEPYRATTPAMVAPRLFVDDADRDDLARWLERQGLGDARIVLVCPAKSEAADATPDAHQCVPAADWPTLIRALLSDPGNYVVVLCGVATDPEQLRQLATSARSPRVRVPAGDLPLRRLMALCERASATISADPDTAQLAAAMGCPVTGPDDDGLESRRHRPDPRDPPGHTADDSPDRHRAERTIVRGTNDAWQGPATHAEDGGPVQAGWGRPTTGRNLAPQ